MIVTIVTAVTAIMIYATYCGFKVYLSVYAHKHHVCPTSKEEPGRASADIFMEASWMAGLSRRNSWAENIESVSERA